MKLQDIYEGIAASQLAPYKKHIKTAVDKNIFLWRGVWSGSTASMNIGSVDVNIWTPKARTSVTGVNSFMYFSLDWTELPRRNYSTFCSTKYDDAEDFGQPHITIPADSVNLFAGTKEDFNGSRNHRLFGLKQLLSCVNMVIGDIKTGHVDDQVTLLRNLLPTSTYDYHKAQIFKAHPKFQEEIASFVSIFDSPEYRALDKLAARWEDAEHQQENTFDAAFAFLGAYKENKFVQARGLSSGRGEAAMKRWLQEIIDICNEHPDDPFSPLTALHKYKGRAMICAIPYADEVFTEMNALQLPAHITWAELHTLVTPEDAGIHLAHSLDEVNNMVGRKFSEVWFEGPYITITADDMHGPDDAPIILHRLLDALH